MIYGVDSDYGMRYVDVLHGLFASHREWHDQQPVV